MKNQLLHICIVVLCAAVSACSATTDTSINPGNVITPLTVLAGTSNNRGTMLRSTDDGETWIEAAIGGSAIDGISTNGSDLYCSTVFGVYRSSNSGTTWLQTDSLPERPAGIYATTSRVFAGMTKTVKWSADKGHSWHSANVDQYSTSMSYFATLGQMLYCASHDAVYVSSDDGNNWSVISKDLDRVGYTALATDDSFLYVAINYAMARTSNSGARWDYVSYPGMTAPINAMTTLNGSIYAANKMQGIYRSTNRGFTWQKLQNDLLGETRGIAVHDTTIFASGIAGSNGPGGITKSTDGGMTWKQVFTEDCLPILIK